MNQNKKNKKELIKLIKKFDALCPDCGKLFLGASINASTEVGRYPIDMGV